MHVVYERCAAIDVGKDEIAVAVRMPGDGPDGRVTVKRTFRAFDGVMGEAARWLVSLGVTHVAMEATGVYSMPVYYALLEHGDFEKVLICNAAHVKNVPGRKTDYADAEWLAHLLECGLLAGSFVPPAEIKAARDVVRYRTKIVQQRVSEIARLGNTLQDAGIKIDSVAWSIATTSGRAMTEALIDGERRGPVLAQLAKGTMRSKIADFVHGAGGPLRRPPRPRSRSRSTRALSWSGWPDSNRRPPAPKAGALTKLRHIPLDRSVAYRPERSARRCAISPWVVPQGVPRAPSPGILADGQAAVPLDGLVAGTLAVLIRQPCGQHAGRAGVAQWQSPSLPSWS
jgi:hypothetical protein